MATRQPSFVHKIATVVACFAVLLFYQPSVAGEERPVDSESKVPKFAFSSFLGLIGTKKHKTISYISAARMWKVAGFIPCKAPSLSTVRVSNTVHRKDS